jgi:hypothetical protein
VVELGGHQREVAGGLEQLIEAGCQLVSGGVVEVEATADTAAKRQQLGSAQPVVQTAVAGEEDTQKLARVEILAGENTQLAEHLGERLLRLVDDEDRSCARGADVLAPSCPQRLEAPQRLCAHRGTPKSSPSSR